MTDKIVVNKTKYILGMVLVLVGIVIGVWFGIVGGFGQLIGQMKALETSNFSIMTALARIIILPALAWKFPARWGLLFMFEVRCDITHQKKERIKAEQEEREEERRRRGQSGKTGEVNV